MKEKEPRTDKRRQDPYMDRRSGEDRRTTYLIDYFSEGKPERREAIERRDKNERREGYVRVSNWSSVCVDGLKKHS